MIKKWLTVIGKTILLLIGITFLSFLLVYHSPGDPAMVALKKSGMRVSEKALELKREELGLNDPFAVQYGRWLNEFFHGDLGESYKTGKAVAGELKKTIPATLLLTVAALALTILISFPIGVLCAKYKDRGFDNMIRFVTYFLSSLPSFFLALLMMYVLSMKLQLLPVIGSVSGKGIIMPALVLALTLSAWYIRQIRGIVLQELQDARDIDIFARVRIFGTSVPFSDPISDISHTFSVLFPAILYIFRPALSPSPLNHQHAIQRIFEIFEIERNFKPSDSST